MANFSFTAKQTISSAVVQDHVKMMHNTIDEAITTAVEKALPSTHVTVFLPKENGIETFKMQIAALEEDGFKVVVTLLEEYWAEMDIIWGSVSEEVENAIENAKAEIATEKFEKAYNAVKHSLKNELIDTRYRYAVNNPVFTQAAKGYDEARLTDIPNAIFQAAYAVSDKQVDEAKIELAKAQVKETVLGAVTKVFRNAIFDMTDWQIKLAEVRNAEQGMKFVNAYNATKARCQKA